MAYSQECYPFYQRQTCRSLQTRQSLFACADSYRTTSDGSEVDRPIPSFSNEQRCAYRASCAYGYGEGKPPISDQLRSPTREWRSAAHLFLRPCPTTTSRALPLMLLDSVLRLVQVTGRSRILELAVLGRTSNRGAVSRSRRHGEYLNCRGRICRSVDVVFVTFLAHELMIFVLNLEGANSTQYLSVNERK